MLLLVLSLTTLVSAENPRSPVPPPTSRPVLVTLKHSETGFVCDFGDVITIFADGTVRHQSGGTPCDWKRAKNVAPVKQKLTPHELAELTTAFDRADFFKMPEDMCGPGLDHRTDLSISHTRKGQTKTVTCRGFGAYTARALIELESQINKIVGARQP